MNKRFRLSLIALLIIVLSGCQGLPDGVHPVDDFNVEKYLGRWYEIARLDHSFERGLERVTADYSLRSDSGVKVINRGYDKKDNKLKEAEGKAYFVEDRDSGYLKVSFFGPFYGSYVVFELDQKDYQYAFVAGPSKDYLWLLSRTPSVTTEIKNRFFAEARRLGFMVGEIIEVKQN